MFPGTRDQANGKARNQNHRQSPPPRVVKAHFQDQNGLFKANIRSFIGAFLHDTKCLTWSDPKWPKWFVTSSEFQLRHYFALFLADLSSLSK
jgi:hypothetical protein